MIEKYGEIALSWLSKNFFAKGGDHYWFNWVDICKNPRSINKNVNLPSINNS